MKLLSASTLLLGTLTLTAQEYNVNTTTQPRNVLIEEFTGIHCGFCPQGHKVGADLMQAHPGRIFVAGFHNGHYAAPNSDGEPDFRTPDGQVVHDYYNISGYPSGLVNRVNFGDTEGPVISRSKWGETARDITSQDSKANVWVGARYDNETRTLTIEAEVYLAQEMPGATLAVYLLQSDIKGYQNGGGGDINSYWHQHVVRDIISDPWGDAIQGTRGQVVKKTYAYSLPVDINEVEIKPEDIEILATVNNPDKTIETVTSCHPELNGVEMPNNVRISEPLIPIDGSWSYPFFEVSLQNKTTQSLTSAEFNVTINTETKVQQVTCDIPARTTVTFNVPIPEGFTLKAPGNSNRYRVDLVKANGQPVSTPTFISGMFKECNTYPTELKMALRTDNHAADNTWRLINCATGEICREFGPFENGKVNELTQNLSLEDGQTYCIEIKDAWGDGVRDPRGQIILRDADSILVAQIREILGFGYRQFFKAEKKSSIAQMPAQYDTFSYAEGVIKGQDITLFNIAGVKVAQAASLLETDGLPAGVYIAVSGGKPHKIVIR